jgi:hypothetical protein
MQNKNFNTLILFFASCQFLAIFSALVILFLKGVVISEPLFSTLRPFHLFFSGVCLYAGGMDIWISIRKNYKGFKLKALSFWFLAIVLFDIWKSEGIIWRRDIFFLVLSGLLVLPSIWFQITALRKNEPK